MNDRLKILGVFAALGFMGGVIANISFHTVWPWLVANFAKIFSTDLVISGVAGAMITTLFVVIWVYLSKPTSQ